MTGAPSRRSLLLGALALSALAPTRGAHAAAPTPRPARAPWGIGPGGELLVVFERVGWGGPGVPPSTVRSLVERGPASLAGLVAAYGLHVLPVVERARRPVLRTSLAVLAHPLQILVVDGQFLLPTLDEALRADLRRQPIEDRELEDGLYAGVAGGEPVDAALLLGNARRLAIEAMAGPSGELVLRRLGMAQLGAWRGSPPTGLPGRSTPGL